MTWKKKTFHFHRACVCYRRENSTILSLFNDLDHHINIFSESIWTACSWPDLQLKTDQKNDQDKYRIRTDYLVLLYLCFICKASSCSQLPLFGCHREAVLVFAFYPYLPPSCRDCKCNCVKQQLWLEAMASCLNSTYIWLSGVKRTKAQTRWHLAYQEAQKKGFPSSDCSDGTNKQLWI